MALNMGLDPDQNMGRELGQNMGWELAQNMGLEMDQNMAEQMGGGRIQDDHRIMDLTGWDYQNNLRGIEN
jgi:hypothetical protein